MKNNIYQKIGLGLLVIFAASVIGAGSWANWKLRVAIPALAYFSSLGNMITGDHDLLDAQKKSANIKNKIEGDNTVSRQAIKTRIDLGELLSGGPGKDGIPSIDSPKFDRAASTPFPADETVLAIEINGDARAYPYGILNWHEIVNDTVGGKPIAITLCPLCDTGIAFSRIIDGEETTFGVSGKLWQSCLVMYDRATDSLYSQPWGIGILGSETNRNLERIPLGKTTLGAWLKKYPESKIMSIDTGYSRDYFRYPYGSYFTDDRLIFPARHQDQLIGGKKDLVSYIWSADSDTPTGQFSGKSAHIIQSELRELGEQILDFGGGKVTARWDAELATPRFFDANENEIPSSSAFGFAWPAFFAK